jgi:hypothetical protein
MPGTVINPDGTPWVPAFEGQRPPFQAGNSLAVKHGIASAVMVDPIAQRIIDEILSDPSTGYLTQARFGPSLRQYALAQAKVELLTNWVDEMPMDQQTYSGKGQTSPLELLRKWMATAQTWASRTGLDPMSAARLGKDISQSRQADAASLLTTLRTQHEAANNG